jgi:hypothetical protein
MARSPQPPLPAVADRVLEPQEATILDLLDHLLNKGVMLNAELTLGVAGIDLIYLRLSSLLCAADRVMPVRRSRSRRYARRSGSRALKSRA